MFGPNLAQAGRYAELLRTEAVRRGLIGPREQDRLWSRHLLNCAALGELIEPSTAVIDVGSGAGLPGVPLALARPDLVITLLEPMARRVAFLQELIDELGLQNVEVVRGRAEDAGVRNSMPPRDVVTARAVAPLDRLARWCLPLLRPGGALLAIKGESAPAELERTRSALRAAGAVRTELVRCGAGVVQPATTVVRVIAGSRRAARRPR